MPRALNEFEKRDRLIERAAEREANKAVSTASAEEDSGVQRR